MRGVMRSPENAFDNLLAKGTNWVVRGCRKSGVKPPHSVRRTLTW